jgi:hypothetical protein
MTISIFEKENVQDVELALLRFGLQNICSEEQYDILRDIKKSYHGFLRFKNISGRIHAAKEEFDISVCHDCGGSTEGIDLE